MFLEFPAQKDLETIETEFMLGPDLLVAPKVDDKFEPYDVKFPAANWYDFWTGQPVSGSSLTVNPPLDTVPVYVRGGSILAEQPVVQNTDEVPRGPLQISVYPGPDCRGALYQDDGNTLAYEHGEYTRMQFTCELRPESLKVNFSTPEARYKTWWGEMQFLLYGFASKPREIAVDGKRISDWQYDLARGMVSLKLTATQAANIAVTK